MKDRQLTAGTISFADPLFWSKIWQDIDVSSSGKFYNKLFEGGKSSEFWLFFYFIFKNPSFFITFEKNNSLQLNVCEKSSKLRFVNNNETSALKETTDLFQLLIYAKLWNFIDDQHL